MAALNEIMKEAMTEKRVCNFKRAKELALQAMAANPEWLKGYYYLAQIDLCNKDYDAAAKSLFTYIEAFTLRVKKSVGRGMIDCLNAEIFILRSFPWVCEVTIGGSVLKKEHLFQLTCRDAAAQDCLIQVFEEAEVLEMLGHCYVCRFPYKFSSYPALTSASKAYEETILNGGAKYTAAYPDELKPVVSIAGFLYGSANVERYASEEEVLRLASRRFIKDFAVF